VKWQNPGRVRHLANENKLTKKTATEAAVFLPIY
jgi:hypothetical protein